MRYFFFYWYRPEQHGGCTSEKGNTEYRQVVTVEMTPVEAARLRDMWGEIESVIDHDERPMHQATMRRMDFSQAALAYNHQAQRVYPLLLAWSLNIHCHTDQATKAWATKIKNRVIRLTQTGNYDMHGFAQEGWTMIPTPEPRLFGYSMMLCDFSFTHGGIEIVTPFGATTPIPWSSLQRLERLAPGGDPRKPIEAKQIKRRTILVR